MAFSHADVQLALRTALLTVPGLPADRQWDNEFVEDPTTHEIVPFQPAVGVSYLTEKYTPQPARILANRSTEHRGLYIVTMFGITGSGTAAIRAVTDAILDTFIPMKGFATTLGNIVRVRGDLAPWPGEIIDIEEGGHSYSQVTIPWFCLATRVFS